MECFGGPVDGSYAPDDRCGWMTIASTEDDSELHFYRRVCIVGPFGKNLDLWHYWGRDPELPPRPLLRPSLRKLK